MKTLKQRIYKFLRWSQKYTKTDNVYLFESGGWLGFSNLFNTLIAIVSSITFANLLDPIVYGNYKYILSITGMLGIFSLGGIAKSITQAVARGLEGSFYTGFKVKLKWSTLGSLNALILASYYFIKGNYLLPIPLIIVAIFLPLVRSFGIYSSFLQGKKLFSIDAQYSTLSTFFSTLISIITVFLTNNVLWLILAYFISNTVLNYIFYSIIKRKFQPNKKEDPQTISYGKHLTLIDLLGQIASQLDRILLFTFIGANQLSIFTFALIIPSQIRSLLKNISILAFPKLSAKPIEEIKKGMKRKVWQLFLLAAVTTISYILIAPYIFRLIFPQYLDSIFYSQIYALAIMTLPFSLILTTFEAKLMKKELYLLQINSFLQIILSLFLVPKFGVSGAIFSRLIVKFINIFFIVFLFKKAQTS